MKYTYFFLITTTAGATGAFLFGSAAKYASSTEMISVSSCPSLTMSASSSISLFSSSFAPTLPGVAEDTEFSEEPSISSSSAPLSPLSPSAQTVRSRAEDAFGCSTRVRRSKNWGNLVACKVYANLQDKSRERLAVIYRCNMQGCIGALIDIESGEQTALLEGLPLESQVSFYGMEVTTDNTTLIVAAGENVQLFDAQTGKFLCSIPVSGKQITRLLCRGSDNFFLGFSDGTVGIGTCKEKEWKVAILPYPSVSLFSINHEGSLGAFARETGVMHVIDIKKQECVVTLHRVRESKITALALEGQKVIVACGRKVLIWNLNGSEKNFPKDTVRFDDFEVSHIAIDPNGSSIAYALTDNTVHLYEGAKKKQVINVGEKILDLWFEDNQLKIYSRNNRLICSLYTVDTKEDFSLVPCPGIYHEPSMFASYGNLYAVYGQRSENLFCISYRPKEYGVDHFLQKMSERAQNAFIFPSEFRNEEQELWENFSLFTKRACVQKFPFLIESELQQQFLKVFLARMKNGANKELYVFDATEEALFRSLHPAIQDVLLQRYPLLVDDCSQAALAYKVESGEGSIVDQDSFMELSSDIRQHLRGKNQRLIVSNSIVIRGFWRMIDAIGLGRFSRRSVRIGTGAFVVAALGIGAWRVWKKYHT